MKKRINGISIGVGLTLLLCSPLFASIDMMLAAHETDSARISALERNLPFLEAKVASTLRDGASKPVSFDGKLQVRSQFHNYSGLADSSWLYLARQGVQINGDNPLLHLGLVVAPGRNTILWSTIGLNASYKGYNSNSFLNPTFTGSDVSRYGWYYDFSHRSTGSAGRGVIGYEDLSAGIAVRSRPASFMLKMGSMNWMEASPLSIWAGSKKAFAWEYLSYEMEEPVSQYFNYKIASLEQVGRGVWNKQPFQGVDFSVIDLPWGLSGYFLYGVGQPFDKNQRYHIDMATDLGYAGDEGSHVEAGIGDAYRKFIFYRLSKRLENRDITFSINNGYTRSNQDVVFSGYQYGESFNQKFNINGDGEGFVVEPNIVSADVKGSIGKNFRFSFDVGMSWVDTNFIIVKGGDSGSEPGHNQMISGTKTVTSSPDFAVYGSGSYVFKTIQASLEAFLATKEFYSPYSMVSNSDAFWAFGSNMLGTQTFLNASGAEYAKNQRALKLTIAPKTPSWHGHLKFGYGLVSQNEESRDIIAMPYRLNGATIQTTLNAWYSKWGLGTITEGYGFNNNQTSTLSKKESFRFGDQSYTGDNAPHIGGLRSDFDGLSENFVPFGDNPELVILNHFAGTSEGGLDVAVKRDLRNGVIGNINGSNGGKGIMVSDKNGVHYYTFKQNGDNAEVIVDGESTGKNISLISESGFVPVNIKRSFDFNIDWALNISKYIGYKNDLFLSLYYETSGITKSFMPLAFVSDKKNNVLLVSHYLRSEPTIGLSKKFYITTLIGFEKWLSGKTWTGVYSDGASPSTGGQKPIADGSSNTLTGIVQSDLETTDIALGVGFDWDIMKRVSLHGRYKWLKHSDENLPFNDYIGNVVSLELKAFF